MNKNIKITIGIIFTVLLLLSPCLLASSKPAGQHPFDVQLQTQTNSIKQNHRRQIQNTFSFPNNLEKGDLLFYDLRPFISLFEPTNPGFADDHVIMYTGRNSIGRHIFIEATDYTSIDLDLAINGVQKTPWIIIYCIANPRTLTIAKVHADQNQKQQAINFTLSNLGEHYQWAWPNNWRYESWHANPDITNTSNPFYDKYYYPDDPCVDQWTCSELVWAAYLHQGIQIDSTPITDPDPDFNNESFFYVGTTDILNSTNVTTCKPVWY